MMPPLHRQKALFSRNEVLVGGDISASWCRYFTGDAFDVSTKRQVHGMAETMSLVLDLIVYEHLR